METTSLIVALTVAVCGYTDDRAENSAALAKHGIARSVQSGRSESCRREAEWLDRSLAVD
jgi:hypothetical protein